MFLSRANLFFAWIQVMEPLKTPKGQYISWKVDTQKAQKKTSFTKRNSTAFGPAWMQIPKVTPNVSNWVFGWFVGFTGLKYHVYNYPRKLQRTDPLNGPPKNLSI